MELHSLCTDWTGVAFFGHGEGKEGNSALKRLLLERHRNNYHVKRN